MRDCYGTREVEIGINGERLIARFTYLPPDLAAGLAGDRIENIVLRTLRGLPRYDKREDDFLSKVEEQIVARRDFWRK